MENGSLTAHLETETTAARSALWDNLPLLRERLSEQGIRIEQFEIDLPEPQNQGESADTQHDRQSRDAREHQAETEFDDSLDADGTGITISDQQIDVVA